MKTIELDKEQLEAAYKECGSLRTTAKKLDCGYKTIKKNLLKYNIKYIPGKSGKKKQAPFLSNDTLQNAANKFKTIREISEYLNCAKSCVTRYCDLYGIKVYNRRPKKYACDNDFFSRDNEESFYWAGFLAADGCVHIRKKNGKKVVTLSLNIRDIDHLKKYKNDTKFAGNILDYLYPSKILLKNNSLSLKNNHMCQVSISSKQLIQDLKRFNVVPAKTLKYKFPKWLINHPLVNHFIRGYMDGDGTLYYRMKNNKVEASEFSIVGNLSFLCTVQKILEKHCDITLGVKIKKNKSSKQTYSLQYCGCYKVSNIINFIYDNSTIYLQRKYEKAQVILTNVLGK